MAERTRRRAAAGNSRGRSRNETAGGRLSRDYTDEEYREPTEGYQGEQPTKGLYTAELFDLRDHETQDGNESVRWGFRLSDGQENKNGDDVSGWPDFVYTTENALWKEQQILVALGIIKPGGKVNLGYEAIVKKAKPCTVRVGVERYIPEDGEPEWRGRMEAFLPLRDATRPSTKTKRAKDDDEAEDVFEDTDAEEIDEDEEEEAPPARGRRSTTRSRRKAEPEPEDEDEDEDEEGEGDEGEGEDYDADALAAELEDLSLAALKRRARDEFGVKIARGMTADEIIEAVLDTLPEDDEDEEDEEEPPPPPKRSSRRTAGKTTTRRKRGSDEPPF